MLHRTNMAMRILTPNDFPAELRLVEEEDAEHIFNLIERNRLYLRQWLPWLDANASLADTQLFIHHSKEQFASKKGFQSAIWCDHQFAGIIGYHPIDWQNRCAMIGYWLGNNSRGRGS